MTPEFITPVQALKSLWVSSITPECDTPTDEVFTIWLRTATFEEITKAIKKVGKKMARNLAAGIPLLGRTAAARYVSSILGHAADLRAKREMSHETR
jgi:hypothetical protein